MAAKRGALVFSNQDFRDIGFEAQKKIVRHFGPLHIHGWAPHPTAGSEEHMIIYDHKEYVFFGKNTRSCANDAVICVFVVRGRVAPRFSGTPTSPRRHRPQALHSSACWSPPSLLVATR